MDISIEITGGMVLKDRDKCEKQSRVCVKCDAMDCNEVKMK